MTSCYLCAFQWYTKDLLGVPLKGRELYLCTEAHSYSAVHTGECVINLLKLSMGLKALLGWEICDIFSTCLIQMGFKSFDSSSHKGTFPCSHLGQALPPTENAVHGDSDTAVPCTGSRRLCPFLNTKEMHWSCKKRDERNGSALCSWAMQLWRDPAEAGSPPLELAQAVHRFSCTAPSPLAEGVRSKDDARDHLHSAWPDLPVGMLQYDKKALLLFHPIPDFSFCKELSNTTITR